MNTNKFYPLRKTTGQPIPIKAINVLYSSPAFQNTPAPDVQVRHRLNLQATVSDSRYGGFLPAFVVDPNTPTQTTIGPAPGAEKLPVPPEVYLPFYAHAFGGVWSISATTGQPYDAQNDISRQLSLTLEIVLEPKGEKLVGGICYGGYPYLPYCITQSGENTANFGLPREFQLTAANDQTGLAGFIDAEYTVTKQEILSHSAFHFLSMDPVAANRLILKLSGFPHYLTQATLTLTASDPRQYAIQSLTEFYGFIIPYLYVYEYEEGTRYAPIVPAGVLASFEEPVASRFTPSGPTVNLRSYFDSEFEIECGGTYALFTASLLRGNERTYLPVVGGLNEANRCPGYQEYYISGLVPPNGTVTLYLEQGEEYDRCIAGIRPCIPIVPEAFPSDAAGLQELKAVLSDTVAAGPDLNTLMNSYLQSPAPDPNLLTSDLIQQLSLPPVTFCSQFLLQVYEIDPVEGVSPLSVGLDGKYATLIAEEQFGGRAQDLSAAFPPNGVKFIRPSASRYFAVVLTNTAKSSGQFVVLNLDLLQSAHVSVSTRAAKTQQITNLHYRLIGADLATDYSKCGQDGFTMAVERWLAGSRKSVLFSVKTLLDLLQTGTAQVHANQRRRAVEVIEEDSVLMGGAQQNFEHRWTSVGGWRSSETGHGVNWTPPSGLPPATLLPNSSPQFPAATVAAPGFVNIANSENRIHTTYLYPDASTSDGALWSVASGVFNSLQACITFAPLITGFQDMVKNIKGNGIGSYPVGNANSSALLNAQWNGIDTSLLLVNGLQTFSQSPFGFAQLAATDINVFLTLLGNLVQLMQSGGSFNDILTVVADALTFVMQVCPLLAGAGPNPLIFLPTLNGLSLGLGFSPLGVGGSVSGSPIMPGVMMNTMSGDQGSIVRQASRTGYAYNQSLANGFDDISSCTPSGEANRQTTRTVHAGQPTDSRVTGAEVVWQGEITDIIAGTIPLDFTLPASAGKTYHTTDDSLRVRLGSGIGSSITVDIWFDIVEEFIKDDY